MRKAAGPSIAERAEMFNAVSVASAQNAEISALFDENQKRLVQAQKVLSELLEQSVGASEQHAEIKSTAKYAMETVSAMRVSCLA